MTDKAKTILLGCFILIACLSTIGVLLFLRPAVGDGKKMLLVCFTSIEKVQIGTRVTFAGKPVGEVVGIREIYDARNQPTGRYGHICFYELQLAIDSGTIVYNTDEVTIHTSGLLGERTIAIVPRPVPKGKPSYPITDQIMYGKSGDPVEETLNQIISIGSKASDAIDQINEILTTNKSEIKEMISAFKTAASHVSSILGDWETGNFGKNVPAIAAHIAHITSELDSDDSLHRTFASFAKVGESLEADWPKVETILSNAEQVSQHLATFTKDFSPDSTIGRLFRSDDVYLQCMSIFTKADLVLSDINNYGFLFNHDKSWQRKRMQEIQILNRLNCPDAFESYFQGQIQQIWICLDRVSQVLRRAQQQACGASVVTQSCFKEEYRQLLDQLDRVEETLKLYREQLIDRKKCGCR